MDDLSLEVIRIFEGKKQRRRRFAGMSFPEKVRAVVRLQQMTAPLLRVWPLDD